uniref:Peptidase S53 domain-containing protein n=1 Tax=Coccolithus braarudii TaxID=221442 RepID=A0A7S0L261_9EUKA
MPHNPMTSSWVKQGKPSEAQNISLIVGLKVEQENLAALEKFFWEVSNPKHEKYGQYKNNAELAEMLAVPAVRVNLVKEYFEKAGAIAEVNVHYDAIKVNMRASLAEKALNTEIYWFSHMNAKDTMIMRASSAYHLPRDIEEHVTIVGELLQFPRIAAPKVAEAVSTGNVSSGWSTGCGTSCGTTFVTPKILSERYGFPYTVSNQKAANGNTMAVAEFQTQYYKQTDIDSFNSACGTTVSVDTLIGKNFNTAGVEAELDIEYMAAVAPSVPLTVINNVQYSLLDWVNQISALDILVHSVSYGNDEAQQTSTSYMTQCNTAFMKAGAKGISILFASGDQGVCGREGCGLFGTGAFHPDFPAGSPYITAVGGTDFVTKSVVGAEQAWSSGGGGFSDTFDIPSYQASAVAGYLANPSADLPPSNLWTSTGRAYPDVAALGGTVNYYCVATGGRFGGVAGTSASSPVVAGIFALLNGLRLNANAPAMGFLNPFIYENCGSFQDVTVGSNPDSGRYGFTAVSGWDPATGCGTPSYGALAAKAMAAYTK